ncbi:hypothetical protein B0H16DRAFT_1769073 [Mycena metata]|uniref:Uncharacterized protein n=1 Tax=Mycena metata TaxID=1033252 RepID=A0AAD7JV04_9AGAR|nr:hypothetical protein B0H16DRAFT_1769073 [Mycena metata]
MSRTEPSTQSVDPPSMVKTEFFSTATTAETPAQGSTHVPSDVAHDAGSPEPALDPTSPAGRNPDMHHSTLFGAGASTREPSSESDIELTPASGEVPEEGVLTAFPLPTVDSLGVGPGPRTKVFVPLPADYQSVGSASRAHLRFEEAQSAGEYRRARMLDNTEARAHHIPVAMNNSASAYASGLGGHRDVLSEFADSAEDVIREIIDGKVGTRIPLPPDVRSPKVAEPHKYRGQDDHELFTMDFLEKLLGWYRSNNYGGGDLNYYRVVLLQNYLEGDAHRWRPATGWSTRQYRRQCASSSWNYYRLGSLVWEVDLALKEEEATRKATASLISASPCDATRNAPRDTRPRDGPRVEKDASGRKTTQANGCYNCGGTDHFARDKKCPNYPGGNVLESYSDEDTDEETDRSASASEDDDANTAPDLDELLAMAEKEEDLVGERMAAMGTSVRTRRFYSMRIVEAGELGESSDEESSITASSVPPSEESELSEGRPPLYDKDGITLGGYNQGPNCIVCSDCARVIRSVRATAENRLVMDQDYSVCKHIAHLQHQSTAVEVNAPRMGIIPLAPSGDSPDRVEGEFEGYELNWLGEPDFDVGIIIDITVPITAGCESVQEEIRDHELARANAGLRPLTALEYDANLRWLTKYRDYTPSHDELAIAEWKEKTDDKLLNHPVYGSGARALELLAELRDLKEDDRRVRDQGKRPWEQEIAQQAISRELGDWAVVHESHLRAQARLRQAVMTRRLSQRVADVLERIVPERANPSSRMAAQIRWNEAYREASELSASLSWALAQLQAEHISAVDLRDEAKASILASRAEGSRFSRSPEVFPRLPPKGVIVRGQENVGVLPADEAQYWVLEGQREILYRRVRRPCSRNSRFRIGKHRRPPNVPT